MVFLRSGMHAFLAVLAHHTKDFKRPRGVFLLYLDKDAITKQYIFDATLGSAL